VWVPETWGTDAVTLLAVLARETHTIKVASGVFNVYSRSAALLAQTAATLQTLSEGRFILGLGASGPTVIENWHGMPYRLPVTRTREYVEIIRTALSGGVVDFQGTVVKVKGFKLLNPPTAVVPIYVAAIGPKNIRLAGETADGWLPIFAAQSRMEAAFAELRAGAVAASRPSHAIDVGAYIPALVGPRAKLLLRQQLAYYIGGMGTFYADMFRRMGKEEDVTRIATWWHAGNRVAAADAVSDALLDLCTLNGEVSDVRKGIEIFREQGISLPIVSLPHGTTLEEAAATIEALAPN
jgi:F420-dependent oxidoreductase-like protein